MRDYRNSGSMTLRSRRRTPRGLVALLALAVCAAIGAYLYWHSVPDTLSPPVATHSDRDRGVIPLTIPGQPAPAEASD